MSTQQSQSTKKESSAQLLEQLQKAQLPETQPETHHKTRKQRPQKTVLQQRLDMRLAKLNAQRNSRMDEFQEKTKTTFSEDEKHLFSQTCKNLGRLPGSRQIKQGLNNINDQIQGSSHNKTLDSARTSAAAAGDEDRKTTTIHVAPEKSLPRQKNNNTKPTRKSKRDSGKSTMVQDPQTLQPRKTLFIPTLREPPSMKHALTM